MSTIIYQFGQLNTAGQMAPGAYVQVVKPPPVVAGVATNGYGLVGVASWGPVNSPTLVGSPQAAQSKLGPVTVRQHDLATALAVAFSLGQYNNTVVRVTDGTDTAATGVLKDSVAATGAYLTALYTGLIGNQIVPTMAKGTKPNTYKLTLSLPGSTPEIFDNIGQGVSGGTVTPGTNYTAVPGVTLSAPQDPKGTQAVAAVTLKAITAAISAAGNNYVTGDTLTLPNGVVLTVTAASGAITALTITQAGSITGGPVPTNPITPTATSGAGTGATVTLTWGLGSFVIKVPGTGYTSATATLTGGGGTGGAIAPAVSVWGNLVNAVNNGQSGVRGPSQLIVASVGTSQGLPALAQTSMTGGTDGDQGVIDEMLIGADVFPPTGMYALQAAAVQTLNLVDHSTTSQWSTIAEFCMQYGIFGPGQTTPGTDITATASDLGTAGVDAYCFKPLVGDWVYWQDVVNNVQRLLAPATFWGPMRANMAPNQSTLNKPVMGLIGTQRSSQNLPYSNPEALAAVQGRVDYLANPSPGGKYFAFQTDQNSSSDASTNSEAYTTMTNFLALTLGANFGYVVGNPQTTDLRQEVNDAITGFLMRLWKNAKYISDVNNPTAQPFKVTLNASNNPDAAVAVGQMAALVQVKYQSIVREFLISLQGGATVQVSVSTPQ